VITTLAGLGSMIFLYFFMAAVANNESGGEAEIVRVSGWLALCLSSSASVCSSTASSSTNPV
jgi:hypothetical protein